MKFLAKVFKIQLALYASHVSESSSTIYTYVNNAVTLVLKDEERDHLTRSGLK